MNQPIVLPRLDDKKALLNFANTNLSNAIRDVVSARVAFEKAGEAEEGRILTELDRIQKELFQLRMSVPDPAYEEIMKLI